MDKTYQDIHICNRLTKEEHVYRHIIIHHISFDKEMIYVSYEDTNFVGALSIPKERHIAIIID